MIHVLRSNILFRMFREKTIFFSRNPLLQILATADTKSIPPPLEGVRNKGGRLYTVLLRLKFQTDVEKQR